MLSTLLLVFIGCDLTKVDPSVTEDSSAEETLSETETLSTDVCEVSVLVTYADGYEVSLFARYEEGLRHQYTIDNENDGVVDLDYNYVYAADRIYTETVYTSTSTYQYLYQYDASDRLTLMVYDHDIDGVADGETRFEYEVDGDTSRVSEAHYDESGTLTYEYVTTDNTSERTLLHQFDTDGRNGFDSESTSWYNSYLDVEFVEHRLMDGTVYGEAAYNYTYDERANYLLIEEDEDANGLVDEIREYTYLDSGEIDQITIYTIEGGVEAVYLTWVYDWSACEAGSAAM